MHPYFYFDSKNFKKFKEITEDYNKLYDLVDILDFENMVFTEKDNLLKMKNNLEDLKITVNECYNDMQNFPMFHLENMFSRYEAQRILLDKYFAKAVLENDRYQNLVKMTSNKEEITKQRRKI